MWNPSTGTKPELKAEIMEGDRLVICQIQVEEMAWEIDSLLFAFLKVKWSQKRQVMHVCKSVCQILQITVRCSAILDIVNHVLIFAGWI
jgi:hypothetical protein